jgi:hypothetical protein
VLVKVSISEVYGWDVQGGGLTFVKHYPVPFHLVQDTSVFVLGR